MLPQILPKERFDEFVERLLAERRVVGPVAKGPQFAFGEIDSPEQLRMDYNTTIQSPKKYFFPPYETLLNFEGGKASAPDLSAATATAILGMHPCDIYATWLLDDVFRSDNADPYYIARRDRALIIGLECFRPCDEQQFCSDMGTLSVKAGYDLLLTDLGDRYFVEVGTPAGKSLVAACQLFTASNPQDLSEKQTFDTQKYANFVKRIPYDVKYLPELLNASYDSLIWDAVARKCFSCGSCNLTCPTCYCFDVNDNLNANVQGGQRQRSWDGCQLKSFAAVAGGENFREHRASRLRHRMFRKGKYMLEAFGKMGCVGCGRCIRVCVAKISILETFQQIAGEVTAEK